MTNRNTLVTAAVVLTVFLAGAVVGAAVVSRVSGGTGEGPDAAAAEHGREDEARRAEAGGDRKDPDDRHGRRRGPDYAVSRILHEELDLDSAQERRVETIMDTRRERAHEIFEATKARLRSQFDSTISELEDVLTRAQAARFDTLLERLKERKGWTDEKEGWHDDDRDGPPGDPSPAGGSGDR